ncbi:MAG: hypothetical protein GY911_00500, partial [Actinomycetales bacterium]|nr:hypothetical protein [Actinomycetales bacterium]
MDNGVVLKPTKCSPLRMNAVFRFAAVSAGDVVFAARAGLPVREFQRLLRPPEESHSYKSVDHLYKDIRWTPATGTRIATQSEQCRHQHIRSEGTEVGRTVWRTPSALAAYLVAIGDPSALALCANTSRGESLPASPSDLQGRLVGLLEDDASFVQCMCAALPKNDAVDDVPIVPTQNLSLHLGLSCLRRQARQSGAFEYCMPEHTMTTERSIYPKVRVAFEDARSYKSRNVMTHTMLLDTFAAHRPDAARGAWGRAADRGALAFDCVYTRSDDGTLRRRLRIQDKGTGNMENIECDHRHDDRTGESREDNRLRARVDKLEWVTHSTNMRRAFGLRLTATMVFASCQDDGDDEGDDEGDDVQGVVQGVVEHVVRSPEGMLARELQAWLAEQLGVSTTQVRTWWEAARRSQEDSTVDLTRWGGGVTRALSDRRCLRLVISQEGEGEVVSLEFPGAEHQQQRQQRQQRVNLERRDGPSRAAWWMLVCVAEDRPMGVLLPGESACVRVINKVCPGLVSDRSSSSQWGMAHTTFQEHRFVMCPFSHDVARRAERWKGDSELLRQVVLAGDEAERGDALRRLRAHYDKYARLVGKPGMDCEERERRRVLEDAVAANIPNWKTYLENVVEHLKVYCLLQLDQKITGPLRHVTNCSSCFAHALVTLWEQHAKVAGSAAWDEDGLPTYPSLTTGYRNRGAINRKQVLQDGRVFVRLFQAVEKLKKLLDGGDDDRLEAFVRSVIREGRDDKENRQENLPAEGTAGVGGTKKRKRGHGGALTPAPQASAPQAPQAPRTTTPEDRAADRPTLDRGEDDDDDLDDDDLAAIEASRDRAADRMTVDSGEEDDDDLDEDDLAAIEASRDRAADRMTVDWGEEDDDDLDEDDLAAIEASRDRAADHMTVDWGEE